MSQPAEYVRIRSGAGDTADPSLPPGEHPDAGLDDAGRLAQGAVPPPGFVFEQRSVDDLLKRVARLERRVRLQLVALVVAVAAGGWLALDALVVEDVIVRNRLMESRELTLLDNEGNPRMFLRMYSKVPVLQLMDSTGRPRMSLGLRFDDTPFLDLSDAKGRTRASLEMTADDTPALRLFDEHGAPTFNIN